jgi:hypothetical protein
MGAAWRFGIVVLATALLAPTGVAGARTRTATATSPAFNVVDERVDCIMPSADNNGHVLGYDAGWSLDDPADGYVYHFFGDTYVDTDGDGVFVPSNFNTGTVARTTDHDASDCVDLQYKTSTSEMNPTPYGNAVAAIPPGPVSGGPSDECLTWPESGAVVNGTIYVYYTSARQCKSDGTAIFSVGIATMTTGMNFTRQKMLWTGNEQRFTAPVRIGSYLYVFGGSANTGNTVHYANVAKVLATSITDKTQYVPQKTLFSESVTAEDGYDGGPLSVAYNAYLGRYLAVYSCGGARKICARTANTPGETESALLGTWGDRVILRDCGYYYACGHAGQHPAYANGAHIYISTNRHDGAGSPRTEVRYFDTMREYTLDKVFSLTPTQSLNDSELQFASTQGANGWSYRSQAGECAWLTVCPNPYAPPLTYDATNYVWYGSEYVAPVTVPRVTADSVTPGPTSAAVRSRYFPTAGTVRMNIEARMIRTCGNGVTINFERKRGPYTKAMRLPVNLYPAYGSGRSVLINGWDFAVEAGDEFIIRVTSNGDASCDQTMLNESFKYDAYGG